MGYRIFRKCLGKFGDWLFGREPKNHRIPFGPLRGMKIFIRFSISPRMFCGVDEPWIAKLAQEYVHPGDVVYDIGAHIGYTCLLFAKRIKRSGSVHAFEILPSVAEGFLKKTIEANDIGNIIIHNVGLSSTERIVDLPIGDTRMTSLYFPQANGHQIESCKLVSLDDYVRKQSLPYPTLMKIDIEGAELDCLRGGKDLIEKCFPWMIIEFHNLDLLKQGFSFLGTLGYRMYLSGGDMINESSLARIGHFYENVLCVPEKSMNNIARYSLANGTHRSFLPKESLLHKHQ